MGVHVGGNYNDVQFAVGGDAISQFGDTVDEAGSGECCCSSQAWELVCVPLSFLLIFTLVDFVFGACLHARGED